MRSIRPLLPLSSFVAMLVLAACGGGGGNHVPSADAGTDQDAFVGATVVLDASASTDADGGDLTFRWSLVGRPTGSRAAIEEADSPQASFVPDRAGAYEAELVVSDGAAEASDRVRIEVAANAAPLADAGEDRLVRVGAEVRLDGSDSHDPDGSALSYAWTLLAAPRESTAELDAPNGRRPRFVADAPGAYRLQLEVSDGAASHADVVEIYANRPPVADASGPASAPVGQPVRLDGSGSSDADGDPLAYAWTFLDTPDGSGVALEGADTASPRFEPDVIGRYSVELAVDDGREVDTSVHAVEVTSESGIVGSTVYVSETAGDDANPGSEEEPLATLHAALAMAEDHEAIEQISLAPGTYDESGYPYTIGSDVSLVGPPEGSPPAVLEAGGANGFEVADDVALYLSRVTIRSTATAIRVGAGSTLDLNGTTCEARTCIGSGVLLFAAGGRVSLTDSVLDGTASGGEFGITIAHGTALSLSRSRVEGFFEAGITAVVTPVGLIDSTLADNGVGLRFNSAGEAYGVSVERGAFERNGTGLLAEYAPRVDVTGASFVDSGKTAVELAGGSTVLLDGVQVTETAADGVVVGASEPAGEVLTMRDTTVTTDGGRGVVVHGSTGLVDLGVDGEPAGNEITAGEGLAIVDARPSGAAGAISVSGTRLNGRYPKGSFVGPDTFYEVTIENDNVILVDSPLD